MKKEKNRLRKAPQFLRTGFVYLFMLLLINATLTNVYKLVGEESAIELLADEEVPTEEAKKLKELSKEYFSCRDNISSKLFTLIENNYSYLITEMLSHYPEKDSPPPKSIYSYS